MITQAKIDTTVSVLKACLEDHEILDLFLACRENAGGERNATEAEFFYECYGTTQYSYTILKIAFTLLFEM